MSLSGLEKLGRDLAQQKPSLIEELARAAKPEDLATIIYTSGTTGEPKGVMLSHSNMVSNLIDSSNHFDFDDKDTALSVLPLSHVFERQAMNMYLHHGMSVYFGQLENLGDYLREVHPTVFVGVPRIYEKIVARVQDKAASKGKLNGAMAQWAIGVGQEWAQHNSDRRAHFVFAFVETQSRGRGVIQKAPERDGRTNSHTGFRRRRAVERYCARVSRRRFADRAGLRSDRNFTGDHRGSAPIHSRRHFRKTRSQRRSAHRRRMARSKRAGRT